MSLAIYPWFVHWVLLIDLYTGRSQKVRIFYWRPLYHLGMFDFFMFLFGCDKRRAPTQTGNFGRVLESSFFSPLRISDPPVAAP